MMDHRCVFLISLCVLAVTGCGWVDSSGRQENRAPGLLELTQIKVEEQAGSSLGVADEDNNLEKVDVTLLDEGKSLAAACIGAGGAFAGLSVDDFADSLDVACDPLRVDQSCVLDIEQSVLTSELNLSDVPSLRRPIARKYQLELQDTDGASAIQELVLCVSTESTAPRAKDDQFDVQYNLARVVPGMEFRSDCGPGTASGVLSNDSDDFDFSEDDANNQQCLVVKELVSAPGFHIGSFELAADGGFTYNAGANLGIGSTDSFSYRITDGVNDSDVATVTIRITGENSAPVAKNPSLVLNEDGGQQVLTAGDLAEDVESDVSALKLLSVNNGESNTSIGQVSYDPNPAVIRYVPNDNLFGTDSFDYQIEDTGGAVVSGSVSVVVNSVNDAPVVTPEQGGVLSLGTGTSGTLEFLVSDVEDGDVAAVGALSSDGSVVAIQSVIQSATLDKWEVAYNALVDGVATITLTATDSQGADTSLDTDFIVGTGVHSLAPVLTTVTLSATQGQLGSWGIVADALASDPDSILADLVFMGTPSSTGGVVTLSADSKSLDFTPSASGSTSISVTIVDPQGHSVSGNLDFAVSAPLTQAPALNSPVLSATQGVAQTWSISGDSLASDPDTAAVDLVFTGVPSSAEGVVSLSADNKSLTFTPSVSGGASISVIVEDPEGNSFSGALSVTVAAPATQPPVLSTTTLTANQGVPQTWAIAGDALAADPDTSSADLVFSSVPSSAGGTVSLSADNKSLTFTPTATGTTAINVEIADPQGNSVTGDLSVSVSP